MNKEELQKKQKSTEIVTDAELESAWGYANFGDTSKRGIIIDTLKKIAQGWSTGHTARCIVADLGLIWKVNSHDALSNKGLKYLLAAESELATLQTVVEVLEDCRKGAKYADDVAENLLNKLTEYTNILNQSQK
jgi:hypothetical protein